MAVAEPSPPPVAFDPDAGAADYRCADCGYGAVLEGELPLCPMCHSLTWVLVRPPARDDR